MMGSTGGMAGTSGEGGTSPPEAGISGGDFFDGDRNTGGNRWPRQETLALLKIRSDMDGVFRDSSLKGPLWEEISRKMAELGYHRSSKKCKEKFENVYKYHKRTKDGRGGKSDAKTYKFFEQLEALEQHHSISPLPPSVPRRETLAHEAVPVTMVIPVGNNQNQNPGGVNVTVTSSPRVINVASNAAQQVNQPYQINNNVAPMVHSQPQQPYHHHPILMEMGSPSATPTSSSSTSSDEEFIGRRSRKRKWKEFFEKMVKDVIDKQDELQKKFLDAVEKREHDRLAREEAWKVAELGRLNRQHELLARERSVSAAKDAALIEVLKKFSEQQHIPLSLPAQTQPEIHMREAIPVVTTGIATIITQQPQPPPQPPPQPQLPVRVPEPIPVPAQPKAQHQQLAFVHANTIINTNVDRHNSNNDGENQQQAGSSRWPKAEVEALINLRTKMDQKYQENGPKGPLWEEISSLMKSLGYNRNAKRCKEKWENINKYFKKVKESNKKRPEDSKTCPYFHQLDALYQQKTTIINPNNSNATNVSCYESHGPVKIENLNLMGSTIAQPEQQWSSQDHGMEDVGSDDGGSEDDGEDDDDEHGSGGGFEIVANNSDNNADNAEVVNTASKTAQI